MIGYQARFEEADSLKALDAATKSWNMGRGEWAQASPAHRIAKVEELVTDMLAKRQKEADEDVTQKAFCDKEMETAKAKIDDKTAKVEKLTTKKE